MPVRTKKPVDAQEVLQLKFIADPIYWVNFYHPWIELDPMQEAAFRDLANLVRCKILKYNNSKNPTLYPMSEADLETAKKIGISIQSGRGIGKDFWLALALLWFMDCFPSPKAMALATTEGQLRNVLWAEIAMIIRKSITPSQLAERMKIPHQEQIGEKAILESKFTLGADKVYLTEQGGREHFIEARTIGKDPNSTENLSGRHSDFMIFAIDEASGVPDPIFKPLEGSLTGICNIMIIIFNPTRPTGYALSTNDEGKGANAYKYIGHRWNAEKSIRIDQDIIREMKKQLGEEDNDYRVDVLGLPPQSTQNSLIPFGWILGAVDKDIAVDDDDIRIGMLDVGGGGDDPSAIGQRHGSVISDIKEFHFDDLMSNVDLVKNFIDAHQIMVMYIDNIAIGAGVLSRLKQDRYYKDIVQPCDVRRIPSERKYKNKRAELYWNLRTQFEEGLISIPNNNTLIQELGSLKYDTDERTGQIQIMAKKKMKKSPNMADLLMMSMAHRGSMPSVIARLRAGQYEEDPVLAKMNKYRNRSNSANAWQGM